MCIQGSGGSGEGKAKQQMTGDGLERACWPKNVR